MNYQETLNYLYSHLPMFTRVGAPAIKKGLTNTIELCKRLHNPEQLFRSVHIAGTNGKGSTSHMLAAILQTAGYKTGLYTSPHLKDFRERIRINGKMIPKSSVISFVKQQQATIEEIEPSFFEVTVGMAFDYFAGKQVDIAVIETGLGGRLDSTNVITPVLSVITNIGYDHMNLLGNTLAEIASEKAGIIKENVPVVIGERQDEISGIFVGKAVENGARLSFASDEWVVGSPESEVGSGEPKIQSSKVRTQDYLIVRVNDSFNLQLDLKGTYQIKNVRTVLSSVAELRRQGLVITDKHISTALGKVKKLTGLRGRWETLSTDPLVICDTGHNQDGIREVLKNIEATPYKKLHIVIGMVKDKDINKILALLPKSAAYYFCSPLLERAKPAPELLDEALMFGLKGKSYSTVGDALKAAKKNAKKKDLIFVGGSTFVVAEII